MLRFYNEEMITDVHLSRLIAAMAEKLGGKRALIYQPCGSDLWTSLSWNAFSQRVDTVSRALVVLGLEEGEMIALFAPNMMEDYLVSFGAYGAGVVVTPFFPNSSVSEVEYMLRDATARLIFVGGQKQYDTVLPVFSHLDSLGRIVLFDPSVKRHVSDNFSITFDEFMQKGADQRFASNVEARKSRASQHDLADILYTSGTTGLSKGVMITYGMYRSALLNNDREINLEQGDTILNFLPLSHIFERTWAYFSLARGCTVIINRDPHEIMKTVQALHPDAMCAVPRFWEKVYTFAVHEANKKGPHAKAAFRMALTVGKRYWQDSSRTGHSPNILLRMQYRIAENLIFVPLRHRLGFGKYRLFPVAGASLSPAVEAFLHACGIPAIVGYGLTETTATVSLDSLGKPITIGSVGRVINGVEVRIDPDGEILVRGEGVTKGYYHKPDETLAAIDSDGWLHTGDAGYLKNGELFLTDRIKNLYKTSNGKYIAPQQIESMLIVDRFVDQIMVVADRFKFVSALIVPEFSALERYAHRYDILYKDKEDLCANAQIHAYLQHRFNELQGGLAEYERVKRFTLLTRPFSQERGEMTNTQKLRRNVIFDHYIPVIEKMYKESENPKAQ